MTQDEACLDGSHSENGDGGAVRFAGAESASPLGDLFRRIHDSYCRGANVAHPRVVHNYVCHNEPANGIRAHHGVGLCGPAAIQKAALP